MVISCFCNGSSECYLKFKQNKPNPLDHTIEHCHKIILTAHSLWTQLYIYICAKRQPISCFWCVCVVCVFAAKNVDESQKNVHLLNLPMWVQPAHITTKSATTTQLLTVVSFAGLNYFVYFCGCYKGQGV